MLPTDAVGIDLGTTYSCIAYLNEHGEPITIPNQDGELSTPSVVLFEGRRHRRDRSTAKFHSASRSGGRHAKRYMGTRPSLEVGGKSYSPVDISTLHFEIDVGQPARRSARSSGR